MPRRPDLACNRCGALMWRGTGALPEGEARCRPCRAVEPQANSRRRADRTCDACGTSYAPHTARSRFCSRRCSARWAGEARRIRFGDDPHTRRAARDAAAPGLTLAQRTRLLRRWKRQRRQCSYCLVRQATTIDHVVPLVRGGNHFEGNLAPCCKRCNSSKSGYTVIEWRSGLRLPAMWSTARHQPPPVKVCRYCSGPYESTAWNSMYCSSTCGVAARESSRPPRPAAHCSRCGEVTRRLKWCSDECWGLAQREKYRARVGIPLAAPKWTRAA